MKEKPRYPGIRVTTNGNQLVSLFTEARIADGGVFYPITPSTEMGEMFQAAFAEGKLNVFGQPKLAIETEGEHAARVARSRSRFAASERSISLPGRVWYTASSNITTHRASARRWWSRWRLGRSPNTP